METVLGNYDYRFVGLSIFMAALCGYALLDLTNRVAFCQKPMRLTWLVGGAIAAGIGLWATNFVSMSAFRLPIEVHAHWPTALAALLMSVAASLLIIFLASRRSVRRGRSAAGSIVVGAGLAAMHFIDGSSLQMPATERFSPALVECTVALAVLASYLSIRQQASLRAQVRSWSARKFCAALIIGPALLSINYLGNATVERAQSTTFAMDHTYAINISALALSCVVVGAILILGFVIITAIFDRQVSRHAEAMNDSRSQLQEIFESLNQGIAVLNAENRIVHMNRSAGNILGSPMVNGIAGAIAETTCELLSLDGELLPREQWPGIQAFEGIFAEERELQIRRKEDGHLTVAAINTVPIRNLAGQIAQVVITFRDITDLKQELDARGRLAAIVESSDDAIFGVDTEGIVKTWNASAERLFGFSADEIIGQSVLCIVPEGLHEEALQNLKTLGREGLIGHYETTRMHRDGKVLSVAVTTSPLFDAKGEIVGLSKILRDITDRKQIERQLRQSQKMEAIGQLTGGISHDFNNLLAIIIGNLSLLERSVTEEGARARVDAAQRAATRGAELTRRLLTFSSDEDLNPAPINLTHSIRNILELAQHLLGPEIKVVTKMVSGMPLVLVDAAGLESAFLNLAVNARDAMPKGGTLTIETELVHLDNTFPSVKTGQLPPGTYVRSSVSDTGQGMSRDTLERAFEPFFTTKPRGKGTGLGLAMVYGFVKQSRGDVRIYSEPNYGTTVTFYLPLAEPTVSMPTPLFENMSLAVTGGKVLVVDDETDLLDVAHAYLQDMGMQVVQATDGPQALELAERMKDLDLIVTDVVMPGMNGVELVKLLRKRNPGVRVIYTSGFTADALSERTDSVVDGLLLHKPYQRSDFVSMVQRIMEHSTSSAGAKAVAPSM